MARLFVSVLGLCLFTGAIAGIFSDCPSSLNTGAVGSCMFSSCSASRGPTHCSFGSCYCNEGYCRYPASTVHVQSRYCVARIPDATCHLTRFCWSGGLSASFCESGLCMCKWGYHPVKNDEGKYDCMPGTSELAAAVARNATGADIEELLEHQQHSEGMVAQNGMVAAAWACCLAVAFLTAPASSLHAGTARRSASRSTAGSWAEPAPRECLSARAHARARARASPRGLCMCKWGYHPVKNDEGKYDCMPGTSELAANVARNATGADIEELLEHQQHSEGMVAQNVMVAAAWACCLAVAFLTAPASSLHAGTARRSASRSTAGSWAEPARACACGPVLAHAHTPRARALARAHECLRSRARASLV
eukprot:CAMPEP_0204610414 /NCGR_PEP_ID=MMETSP0661-20131031/61491_1 /ASSEMBLY_ACC=CAM_ASM_000606 /TAXON_ID=109239 /ORGANISM="Alexandrium margalefi, Strain AMGDE01CS-322" /LENGTH=364 /DNA_ID=CAMNT_0051622221 /DNA_START=106 /DNA_END=1199 /DNA_ORIENTATION=+